MVGGSREPWRVESLVLPLTRGTATERMVSRNPSIHSGFRRPWGHQRWVAARQSMRPFSVPWAMWASQACYKDPQAFPAGPQRWHREARRLSSPEPWGQHWPPPGATPQPRGPVLAGLLCCGLSSCRKPLLLRGFTPVFPHSAEHISICEATLLSLCQIRLSYLLMLWLVLLNHF